MVVRRFFAYKVLFYVQLFSDRNLEILDRQIIIRNTVSAALLYALVLCRGSAIGKAGGFLSMRVVIPRKKG